MTKLKKPLLAVLFLYSICYLFRFIEYFLIQTDRTFWGEAFLHKAMGDHFVNNTIVNMLHAVSSSGADELMFVRMSIAQTFSFVIVLIVYLKKRRLNTRTAFYRLLGNQRKIVGAKQFVRQEK